MRDRRLKIFFDGGCRPNPGAMETAVVARGILRHASGLGHGTSNDAEWLALIAALRLAQALGVADFELIGDSALVVNQANGVWTCRGADLQRHRDVFEAVRDGSPVRIRHIRRTQNLAGIALAKLRSGA